MMLPSQHTLTRSVIRTQPGAKEEPAAHRLGQKMWAQSPSSPQGLQTLPIPAPQGSTGTSSNRKRLQEHGLQPSHRAGTTVSTGIRAPSWTPGRAGTRTGPRGGRAAWVSAQLSTPPSHGQQDSENGAAQAIRAPHSAHGPPLTCPHPRLCPRATPYLSPPPALPTGRPLPVPTSFPKLGMAGPATSAFVGQPPTPTSPP